jgi:histone acetyltransferase (RNA polymerase elongator complex component)
MKIYPVLEIDLSENQKAYVNVIEIYTSLDDAENHVRSNFDSFKEIDNEEFNKLANKRNLSIINQCKIYSAVCNGHQFY